MTSAERPRPTILENIDSLLEENARTLKAVAVAPEGSIPAREFRPVDLQEVKSFTNSLWSGKDEEGTELSSIKDTAVAFLGAPSVYKHFVGSMEFGKVFSEFTKLRKEYEAQYPDTWDRDEDEMDWRQQEDEKPVVAKSRELRNRVLANVLSTDPETLPEALKDKAVAIGTRYHVLKEAYELRKKSEGNKK